MPRVLIIEDEVDILENVGELLALEGFDILTAPNGREGVKVALAHQPDLIVSDIKMPELDGYGVLLELRNDPRTSLTPFIFLTARADRESMRQGMELGADDYLMKPFEPLELIKAVHTRLQKQQQMLEDQNSRLAKLRNNIVQAVPHELRTPLTGILGCAEYLLMDYEEIEPQRIHDTAQIILRSGRRLQKIIENYVLYAQIEVTLADEERVTAMRQERLEYPEIVIRQVSEEIAHLAKREHDLTLDLAPMTIAISQDNLQKIIYEIVDNAFRFSQKDSQIEINAANNGKAYVVTIHDHGRGMKQEDTRNIGAYNQFDREFYEHQGLGLGLIIAKRLTEIHDGKFDLTSALNEGTTVTLTFPAG